MQLIHFAIQKKLIHYKTTILQWERKTATKRNTKSKQKRIKIYDDVKNGKPDPEVFLIAAKKLGLDPKDCVAFEDSINGIKSAHAAGMTTVMVPDLLEPTEEIKPMIDFLCTDLSKAIEQIEN